MSEEPNILDFLRVRFNRIDARLDEHTSRFDELITRVGALERGQGSKRRHCSPAA
jgi:hypothetical protein